ncbi:hypothetical protein CCY01nite_17030 [Chitinophaga cymbidii]|uniref:Uncharacterized protein n=1 Tax=Chitinophaga cymbidii TaxID=1096750 RepID=A0A512RIB6_9BACT|nr:hypothetical protein CCY01nite_17030 [Chitinophaga cymbidii]
MKIWHPFSADFCGNSTPYIFIKACTLLEKNLYICEQPEQCKINVQKNIQFLYREKGKRYKVIRGFD